MAAIVGFAAICFLPRLQLMTHHCESIDARTIAEMADDLDGIHRYVPTDTDAGEVEFEFNVGRESDDSIFVIMSNKVQTAVYHGPFRKKLRIPFDDVLAADGGDDLLEFRLLLPSEKLSCHWLSDNGENYWRPGARILVDVLPHFTMGDRQMGEGTPWNYEVKFR